MNQAIWAPTFALLLMLSLRLSDADVPGPRAPADPPVNGPERAVWVWEQDSFALLDEKRTWAEFTAFLERHSISTVYLYADSYEGRSIIEDEPGRYRRFLRHLHVQGVQVYALLGSKYLRTQEYVLPGKRAEAEAMLRRVLLYNRDAERATRFDGINVDIEPHLLDEWDAGRRGLAENFLELSERYMEMKGEYGFQGPVGPAIPFWYDGVMVGEAGEARRLSEQIQDVYDFVALMAYRDRAAGRDGIVRHVTDELEYAQRSGGKVFVGLETKSGDLDKVTFHEETPAEMEKELRETEEQLHTYAGFAGFVIHHYGSYRDWLRARGRR